MNRRPAHLPKRLHEHVVDHLGQRIVRGDYATDAVLPTEDALVVELGVSRTVVREAIKVLAQKNLIQVRTRTGSRVCHPTVWNQLDPDILRWRFAGEFDPKLLADVVDLRRIFEPAAAELAALRATPQEIAALRDAFAVMSDETAVQAHIEADVGFHLGILEAAGNELLLGLRHSIEGALQFAITFSTHTKDDGLNSLDMHGAVLHAIERHEPQRARAAMLVLVDSWAEDCQRIVQAQKSRAARARRHATAARPATVGAAQVRP